MPNAPISIIIRAVVVVEVVLLSISLIIFLNIILCALKLDYDFDLFKNYISVNELYICNYAL